MIVTLTPNTALDLNVYIPSFRPGMVRASRAGLSMGGKAADASYILGRLGIPSLALGFAAGEFGRRMEIMLQERGVKTDFTWVKGETRLNPMITCEDGSGETTIGVNTLVVESKHIVDLNHKLEQALKTADCLILGGSLPIGVEPARYEEWIVMAHAQGIPVLFDASGAALRAGMEGKPSMVKPNRTELEQLVGRKVERVAEAYAAARQVQAQYGAQVVVSLGADGVLALLEGRTYLIPPLQVQVVSTAGAGDALLAGLGVALARHQPVEEGLRLGVAAAGAVVSMPGTADCRPEEVERLLPMVKLLDYQL